MTYEQFTTLLSPYLPTLPAVCGEEAVQKRLWQIGEKLVENNRKYNLTAITEPEAVVEKHIVDSLLPLSILIQQGILTEALTLPDEKQTPNVPPNVPPNGTLNVPLNGTLRQTNGTLRQTNGTLRLIDIGAGAGFPSLPFAAVLPEKTTRILAVDATAKKVRHITETAAACGISHMAAEAGRAEELSQGKLRESFTIATARAVAELRILVELTAPFVAVGGMVVALKGSHGADEVADAAGIAKALGLSEPQIHEYTLPSGDGRTLIVYNKVRSTPKEYPRPYNKIKAGK